MAEENEDLPVEDKDEDCLVFHEERQTKKIKILDKEGKATYYMLREMDSPSVAKWQGYDAKRIKVSRSGRIDMSEDAFKDYSATLINLCLWDLNLTDRIPISKIKTWGALTLNGLFDFCQTMNGLNAEGKEQAKKA